MASQPARSFWGRTAEWDHLYRLLDTVRAGESAALVVRGVAGVGKTALLDQFAGRATGFQISRVAGMQSEMELPFAGLHQLCSPMLNQLDVLADPQQEALRVAFGLTSGSAPDRFLVALATLSLLAEVAQKRPLLCVIDDAQWLDAETGQVFGFVARRVLAESVFILFAVREPNDDRHLVGLPELTLHGLPDDDARALLKAVVPGRLDADVRDRIVAETHGNPLALLELPRGMTTAELAGGFLVPDSRDITGHLEEHFLRRLDALPEATRRLMLVAAADPTGDGLLLWRAADQLGIERDAASGADVEQLVEIGTHVRFRHPLVRSAIYSGSAAADRRAVHLALAEGTDPQTDPDRRAWHRALAADGPDEALADELERSASRAQSRGGLAATAAFLQRCVGLTEDPERRADRALAAAQAHIQAAVFGAALRLLAAAEFDAQTELQRARIDLLRGQLASATGSRAEAAVQLLKAARRLEELDVDLARETYLDALAAVRSAARLGVSGQVNDVALAARSAPAPSHPPRLSDLLLDGYSLLLGQGLAAAAPALRKAVDAYPREELSVEKGHHWGILAAAAATALWDFEGLAAVSNRQTQIARQAGALAPLCFTLSSDVFVMAWRGDFAAADALLAELVAVTDVAGTREPPVGALWLAALKGDEPHSSAFIKAATDLGRSRDEGTVVDAGFLATAILSNGLARYEQAMASARQASDATVFHIAVWALPELIEAAVRTGNDSDALEALERLAGSTNVSEGDWARGLFSRCQALVSDAKTAEDRYREAVDCFSKTALRPEHARTHLLYGEWLRRQNRRVDAREHLRTAFDMFSEIGMLAFAERTLHELRATGETVRRRREDTRDDLTPQEEHIARLATEGRTNPEIGAQLYISARTVEWHLRKVFTKLGVSSRKELSGALPAQGRTSH